MASFFEVVLSLLFPWQFLGIAISYLPSALRRLLQTNSLQDLTYKHVKDTWFSEFWNRTGANIRQGNGTRITALLEGRISRASVVDKPVVAPAGGVVLDIGPGSGFWVDLYAKADTGDLQVFGVEPNVAVHGDLRMRVHQSGLDGVYNIISAGIEDIDKFQVIGFDGSASKIEKGSVDSIVTLLCLCGIPEPEKNIAELYQYLKKGGRWYVFEHVKHGGPWYMRFYQGVCPFMQRSGGCLCVKHSSICSGRTSLEAAVCAEVSLMPCTFDTFLADHGTPRYETKPIERWAMGASRSCTAA